jgi:hypothetical protein
VLLEPLFGGMRSDSDVNAGLAANIAGVRGKESAFEKH